MKNRNFSLDVVRTFAILFVVANHAIEMIFPFKNRTNGINLFCEMSLTNQLFQFVVFTIGRLGVPLFFMLTGYLLVTRDYFTKEKIIKFYKKNFLGLVLVWYVWIIIYNVFLLVFAQKQFVIHKILLEMLLIKNVPLMHTWYMNEIIVIYAIIPLLAYILHKIGHAHYIIVGILLVTVMNNVFGGIRYVDFYVPKLMYIAYVIAGYHFAVFKTYPDRRACFAFFIIGFAIIVGWQIYSYHSMNPINVWYTDPLHYLVSLSLASLLFRHNWGKGHFVPYIEWISITSFGIYLLHVPVMWIIISIMPYLRDVAISNVVLLYCISFVSSSTIILLISRIPIIGKTVLYIK